MAGSSKIDRIVNIVVCMGAAIVIFGAWQKITHQKMADFFLTAGLITEAIIFVVYAFLPPPANDMAAIAEILPKMAGNAPATGNPNMQKLDDMLKDADITPASLKSLSDGFKKLNTSVNGIAEVGDVVKTTSDYSAKTKEATAALESMKNAYTGAATTIGHFNTAADGTKKFHEQVQVLTKNLGSLNAIYELELQDTNNHLKAMNSFYSNLADASQTMKGSVEDAKKAHEQIAKLSSNLSSLNTVYGNMLSAMQGR
ncbi:MAG: gliding motility protein GldL [Chitinophagaceae bacterium]|jgi:gliding motility-associated protein GldL|nr:MAG: gliding motility protein GldL [Chitinophagaceae bacterium]